MNDKQRQSKLEELAELEGYANSLELLGDYYTDSVVPAICTNPNCSYIAYYEPDQTAGWCGECQDTTCVSAFELYLGSHHTQA